MPTRSSPRRDRLLISLPRPFLALVGVAAVVVVTGAFFAGTRVGGDEEPKSQTLVVSADRGGKVSRTEVSTADKAPAPKEPQQASASASVDASVVDATPAADSSTVAEVRMELVRTAPDDGYGVQLGAFETEAEALDFLSKHATALEDMTIYLLPIDLKGRGTWFRVRVGHTQRKGKAESMRDQLAKEIPVKALVVTYR